MMTEARPELPELYDLDCGEFADDLLFYENLARRGDGPVLELGTGTGRAAIPLARAGFDVWGIDSSEAMLDRARSKAGDAENPHFISGDMRDFQLDRTFDLIFAGLGAFHHLLTSGDQLACLRCVANHLSPDGLFVCDLRPLLHEDWEAGESAPLLHDWTRSHPRTGETVTKLRSVHADTALQIKRTTLIYDISPADGAVRRGTGGGMRRITAEVDVRFTTRYEMKELLQHAGLTLDGIYGDFDLSPYDNDSEYMITVARTANKERS